MTEDERGLQAARSWLQYWKSLAADGEQSWLGRENARTEVMRYARVIADYERRLADGQATGEAGSDDASVVTRRDEEGTNA